MRQNPFRTARFIMSGAKLPQLPEDKVPELAFAGRSNAGKSSALNVLCNQVGLARVSKTPGRTQLINLFDVPNLCRLTDLPGYGYAAVPREVQKDWGRLIGGYVETRPNLRGLIVIMDARHPLTPLDQQMLGWTQNRTLPAHILLTKADKLSASAARATLADVRKKLPAGVTAQLFSALKREGVDEAVERLLQLLGH